MTKQKSSKVPPRNPVAEEMNKMHRSKRISDYTDKRFINDNEDSLQEYEEYLLDTEEEMLEYEFED